MHLNLVTKRGYMRSYNLDDETMKKLSLIYKKWLFHPIRLYRIFEVIQESEEFRNMIFKNTEKYRKWTNKVSKQINISEDKLFLKTNRKKTRGYLINNKNPITDYLLSDSETIKNIVTKYGDIEHPSFSKIENLYNSLRKKIGYDIVKTLDIKSCYVCGINMIEAFMVKEKKYFKGEFDHHYNKSDYKYLSINLYNLIPVCKACNHTKSFNPKRIINPYNTNIEMKYNYNVKLYGEEESLININKQAKTKESENFDIKVFEGIGTNFNIKIESDDIIVNNTKEVIYLEERINSHKDLVSEIFKHSYWYSTAYRKQLKKITEKYIEDENIFDSFENFVSFIYGEDLLNNKSTKEFFKLKKDIIRLCNER